MLVPKLAIYDTYATYDGYATGGASEEGGTGKHPNVPCATFCIAFKHGECAKGVSCECPHLTSEQIAAEMNARMEEATQNPVINAKVCGDLKTKPTRK